MPSGSDSPRREGATEPLSSEIWDHDLLEVATELLNKVLVTGDGRVGRIIEVEAYGGADDPASHAFRGRTPRTKSMWGPPGHLYTYFTYGMHWCANVVTGEEGVAQAVLLRALEPIAGLETMRAARWRSQLVQRDRDLCRGPGRLCEALGIAGPLDGVDLRRPSGLWLGDDGTTPPSKPAWGPRVGISAARDRPWRCWVEGHSGISGPHTRSGRRDLPNPDGGR